MQGLSLLAGAATVALAYLYLVHFGYTSRAVALATALFCATSAYFLYFSSITLSEIPYALISILALWAIERQTRSPLEKPGWQIVLGLLLGLPFLTAQHRSGFSAGGLGDALSGRKAYSLGQSRSCIRRGAVGSLDDCRAATYPR